MAWTEGTPPLPDAMPGGTPWPSIGIVTPSYDQGQFLEEAIRSVLLQGYPNLEYVVIDGGSTDHSVEIIRKYEPWLRYWVSEPDRGQPHAINKGLALLTSELFNWINSDDLLVPGVLATIAQALGGADAVAGVCVNFTGQGGGKAVSNAGLTSRGLILSKRGTVFQRPSLWLRREQVLGCGGIDERFQYVFDWDLSIRYLSLYPKVSYSPAVLSRFRLHKNSKTVRDSEKSYRERALVLQRLSTQDRVKSLHRDCNFELRRMHWMNRLSHAMDGRSVAGWRRALNIGLAALSDPSVRWSRFTAGAIRRCWKGKTD